MALLLDASGDNHLRGDEMRKQIRVLKDELSKRFGFASSKRLLIVCSVILACICVVSVVISCSHTTTHIERQEPAQSVLAGVATTEASATTQAKTQETHHIVIHVDGAVDNPGLVRLLADDARVADAVEASGGLTQEADTAAINLAARIEDGTKIYIPHKGETPTQSLVQTPSETTVESIQSATSSSSSSSQQSSGKININNASKDELMSLSGVGEATATAIIEDRETNGPFSSVEDLMRVSGIGEKKFAKMQNDICV